jgi:hypothetical protein
MAPLDQAAKAVYSHFSNSQLRELALAARVPPAKVARLTSQAALTETIDALPERHKLATIAHRIEAVTPYKHCVLVEIDRELSYSSATASCLRSFPELSDGFVPLDSAESDIQPQLLLSDETSERIFLKFAHMVKVYENHVTTEGLLRVEAKRRHVMVALIIPKLKIVAICFPGYTQAVPGDETVTYNAFALQIAKRLEEVLRVKLPPFKLKPTTDLLLDDPSEHIVDLRRTVRFRRGGRMALDSESDEDAASALAEGISNTTGFNLSPEVIRIAFRFSEAQSIVLLWQAQAIITRVSLRNSLPEVLFIWGQTPTSLTVIETVLARLAKANSLLDSDGLRSASAAIKDAPPGDVIRPGWLEQHFALRPQAAVELLLDSCSKKMCVPVFRVRSDRAVGVPSVWAESLTELPLIAHTEQGEPISARSPENVEVAFKRIAREPAEKVVG